jgi:hypothetical protein
MEKINDLADKARWAFLAQRRKMGLPELRAADFKGRDVFDVHAKFLRENGELLPFAKRYTQLEESAAVRKLSIFSELAAAYSGAEDFDPELLPHLRTHFAMAESFKK